LCSLIRARASCGNPRTHRRRRSVRLRSEPAAHASRHRQNAPFEEIRADTGSGFRFAAEAFAKVVGERDFEAIRRAAQASLDNRRLGGGWPQRTIGAGGAGAGAPFTSNADS